ncbi:cytochrome oxidase assembly protein 1, partial [Gaertneriomyces semiglobifer]
PYPYLALASVGLAWWGQVVFEGINSQKAHSGIFKSVIFHLRHHDKAKALLGNDIHYDAERHPSVQGSVNMFKGKADLEFTVEGDKGKATVKFIGNRGEDDWHSRVFEL